MTLALVVRPATAIAEVSDKAASIPDHWIVAVPVAILVFLIARFRWWLAIPIAVVPAIFLSGSFDMTADPHIGGGLWQEQGLPYFLSLWSSDLFVVVALGAGAFRGWRRRRSRTPPSLPNKPLQADGAAAHTNV
jgi:hypothetical protein